jgi:hypothetical protein
MRKCSNGGHEQKCQSCAPLLYSPSRVGKSTASTPAFSSCAKSRASSRGYVSRSSCAPNCVGFTKIVATTMSVSLRARLTKAMCPSWRYPMVGTSPTLKSCRTARYAGGYDRPAEHLSGVLRTAGSAARNERKSSTSLNTRRPFSFAKELLKRCPCGVHEYRHQIACFRQAPAHPIANHRWFRRPCWGRGLLLWFRRPAVEMKRE